MNPVSPNIEPTNRSDEGHILTSNSIDKPGTPLRCSQDGISRPPASCYAIVSYGPKHISQTHSFEHMSPINSDANRRATDDQRRLSARTCCTPRKPLELKTFGCGETIQSAFREFCTEVFLFYSWVRSTFKLTTVETSTTSTTVTRGPRDARRIQRGDCALGVTR